MSSAVKETGVGSGECPRGVYRSPGKTLRRLIRHLSKQIELDMAILPMMGKAKLIVSLGGR